MQEMWGMRKLAWSCQSQPGLDPSLLEGQFPGRAADGMKVLAGGKWAASATERLFIVVHTTVM